MTVFGDLETSTLREIPAGRAIGHDIDADRNPELVRCVVEANRQLQTKLRRSSVSDR